MSAEHIYQNWIFLNKYRTYSIHKCCIQISEEDTYLVKTSHSVSKLRYRAHAQKCKPLLHYTSYLE